MATNEGARVTCCMAVGSLGKQDRTSWIRVRAEGTQTQKTNTMAALALLAGPLFSVAATTDLLWLPLGDSITWGCGTDAAPRGGAACAGDAGGYRVPMAWALSQQVITHH